MQIGTVIAVGAGTKNPPAVIGNPTFVAASTDGQADFTAFPTPPTGTQAGDVLVMVVAANNAGASLDVQFTAWTARANATATGMAAAVFSRVATGSEPASYGPTDINNVSSQIRATVLAYRPATGNTLTVAASAQGNASGTSQATPSLAVSGDHAALVVVGAAAAAHSWTAPAGMSEESDVGTNMTVGAFDLIPVSAGSVSKTATLDTAAVAVMAIVALVPS